jgi:xylan 1,4-beta-xylosidase
MSYWTFTDVFEEIGPGPTLFHGGFGLINLTGIRKPSYYAYKFMNELGEKELVNGDSSSYICMSSNGDVQALVWECTFNPTGRLFNQGYFITPHVPKALAPAQLEINGLKNGKYRLEIYKVGYKENDPFTRYLEMGRPVHTTVQQEKELAALSKGLPAATETVTITNGTFKKQLPLRENDIVFVKLIRVKD